MNPDPRDERSSAPSQSERRSSRASEGSASRRFDGDADAAGPILVPIAGDGGPTPAFAFAVALGRATGRDLLFLDPDGASDPATGDPDATGGDRLVERRIAQTRESSDGEVNATGVVGGGRSVASAVENAASAAGARTVVIDERYGDGVLSGLRSSVGERIAAAAGVDVVQMSGRGSLDGVRSVLVAVGGGPHSGLAVDAARAMASATDAWIDVLHVVEADATESERDDARAVLAEAHARLSPFERADTWLLNAEPGEDVADVLIRQTQYYDAIVMGAPTRGRLRRFVSGSTTEEVSETARVPVVVVSDSTERSWSERIAPAAGRDG